MIREGKEHQVNNVIQTNGAAGMRTMDDALSDLCARGYITRENAFEHCVDVDYIKTIIR
jgi:twitching motility protein PilT